MVENTSLSLALKRLEAEVRRNIRLTAPERLGPKEKNTLADLAQSLTDARIYVQAYELSETRQQQQDSAQQAKHWLSKGQKDILTISERGVFGAADVAQLSAQIEQISANLK